MRSEGVQSERIIIPPQLLAEEHMELRKMVEDGTLTAEGALSVIGVVVQPPVAEPLPDARGEEIAIQTRKALDRVLAKQKPAVAPVPLAGETAPDISGQLKVKRSRTRISVLNAVKAIFGDFDDFTKVARILILRTQIRANRLSINEMYEILLRESDDNIDFTPQKIEGILHRLPEMIAKRGIVVNIKSEVKYRRGRGEMGFWLTIQ